ncbi:histidine kinase [Desulfitobacterium hafniense DCB-2]|uniref:Oxygen sensor histidine kinase NreB n=1 Tax=Desulfitobacterium hafniense (strain DSM 10664 / DCB-2) TaxID=272564 RepID=B8G136_DESHD|nr:ATP-binding protein [Desulfitobacterium hafniense]ACL19251.1 histidine kinase [Desulfitobacterium hafniense DCB-2]
MKVKHYLRRMWLHFNNLKIQYKILGLVIGIVVLLTSMSVWIMGNILTTNLRDQLDMRAISIGSDVAARSTNDLLIKNTFSVYEMINETLKNNQNLVYIFVLDPDGNVLAHTFGNVFPNELLKANSVRDAERSHLTAFATEIGVVRDVAVPILDGKLGTVRVGMDELGLREAVVTMVWSFVATALFVSALGITAAVILTKVLTRPVRELVALTQKVARGNLTVQGTVRAEDEIGVLTQAFNQMINSLSETNRERENLLAKLKENEGMRIQLLEKVMIAQEEERKRISRELHDETSQALTSLMVGLKILEAETSISSVGEKAQEMRQVVSQTLDEVHHMARELRPSVLDDMGLIPALGRYIRDYQQKYGTEVDFHASGFEGQRLTASAEVAFYRIIQEALTNVAKYAQADSVSVVLDWREHWVTAIVEDDGVGFDTENVTNEPSHGLGLFGMRERAALLGGSVNIESKLGTGTTVFIKIPIQDEFMENGERGVNGEQEA